MDLGELSIRLLPSLRILIVNLLTCPIPAIKTCEHILLVILMGQKRKIVRLAYMSNKGMCLPNSVYLVINIKLEELIVKHFIIHGVVTLFKAFFETQEVRLMAQVQRPLND